MKKITVLKEVINLVENITKSVAVFKKTRIKYDNMIINKDDALTKMTRM